MPVQASIESLHDLDLPALRSRLAEDGVKPVHAAALWRWMYREDGSDLTAAAFLPPLRRWLDAGNTPWTLDRPEIVQEFVSSDGLTRKFLLRLEDGHTIETVLMGYDGRHTACISTQVGCAMGCVFCATGQGGFVRHLRAGEIVSQVLLARRMLKKADPTKRLRNLVLMGMGEPLHNYDATMRALDIVSDDRGLSIGPAHIAISTVGVVPGILRMAKESRPYRLAVSLHGASEEERAALVPISRRWPLTELIDACREYGRITGKRIFFEWTLIEGKNDSIDTAECLIRLLEGIDAHVNLIPLNPTDGFEGCQSQNEAALRFQATLRRAKLPCTFRQRRGIDVAAGCGMLRARNRKRRTEAEAGA